VRRVNIRQLMPFEGTRAYDENTLGAHRALFASFKAHVREKFDLPMLQRVFPTGTVLRKVVVEVEGDPSFGRQMGSYPILVGVPLRIRPLSVIDAVVVDHGMRSLSALPVPIEVNALPVRALSWIPGVGRQRAARIAGARPFRDLAEFRAVAGPLPLDHLLSFS